jgi:hypothetical protein
MLLDCDMGENHRVVGTVEGLSELSPKLRVPALD